MHKQVLDITTTLGKFASVGLVILLVASIYSLAKTRGERDEALESLVGSQATIAQLENQLRDAAQMDIQSVSIQADGTPFQANLFCSDDQEESSFSVVIGTSAGSVEARCSQR